MVIKSKIYKGYSRYIIYSRGDIFNTKLGQFVSQQIDDCGYPCITLLADNGKRKTFKVHRLIALCFIKNKASKKEVNHKNGVKTDNYYLNLEWMSHSENIQHAWDSGLLKNTPSRSAKLSKAHLGRNKGASNPKAVKVKCITTGEIFACQSDAGRKYRIEPSGISKSCMTGCHAGRCLITNKLLKWEYA